MKITPCKRCKKPVHIAHFKDEADNIRIVILDSKTPVYQVSRGIAVRAVNIIGRYVAEHECGER